MNPLRKVVYLIFAIIRLRNSAQRRSRLLKGARKEFEFIPTTFSRKYNGSQFRVVSHVVIAAIRLRRMVAPHPRPMGGAFQDYKGSSVSHSKKYDGTSRPRVMRIKFWNYNSRQGTFPVPRESNGSKLFRIVCVIIAAFRLRNLVKSRRSSLLGGPFQDFKSPPATLSSMYDGTPHKRSIGIGGAFQNYKVSSVSHLKKNDGASRPRGMRVKFWNYNYREGSHPGKSKGSKFFQIVFVIIAAFRLIKLVKSRRSRKIHKVDQPQLLLGKIFPSSPIESSNDDMDFSFWSSKHSVTAEAASSSVTAEPSVSSSVTVSQASSPVGFSTLPDDIHLCLLYVFSFPPGYEFERDTMVQLWMAREFFHEEGTQRIEDRGNQIFELLVSLDLIVPLRFDKRHDLLRFKMSESKIMEVYPDGLSSPDDFLLVDEDKFYDLSKMQKFNHDIFGPYHKLMKLQTLVLLGDFKNSVKQVPRDLFLNFGKLTTLDLSGTQICELPSSIGNLEDLKYLDLSYTPIREFPGLFCALENLQTLKLRDCSMLVALPRDMMKMIKLRHLDLDIVRQLNSMPKCIGKLVNLQTLKGFIVGVDDECGIGQLSHLKGITGSFCLSRLENVQTVDQAIKADLRNKRYITKLEFRWEESINMEMEEQILEYLVPHPNLEELQIQFYSGSALPHWISDNSFTKITSITLFKCINCSFLPCIGNLPSLKFLNILGMETLREINSLFCRNTRKRRSAFPMLEKLTLENMMLLEKWTGVEDLDFPCLLHVSIKYCPKLSHFPLMFKQSSLKYLELNKCDELQCLPEALPSSLDTLIIEDCPMLQRRCMKDEGEDWAKIAHVPNIWVDDQQICQD